MFLKLCNEVQF